MEKSNVDLVVKYLFVGGPKPALVLGQEDCSSFMDMWGNVVMNLLKPATPLFLKILVNKFWWPPISFDSRRITTPPTNTILVDDCPYKDVCNPDEWGLFPNPFTSNRVQDSDMTKDLLPYFQSLFYSPMFDARDFVVSRRFGQLPIRHNDAIKMAVMKSPAFKGPDLHPVDVTLIELGEK